MSPAVQDPFELSQGVVELRGIPYRAPVQAKESPVSGSGRPNSLFRVPIDIGILQAFSCSRTMAKVRQAAAHPWSLRAQEVR